MAKAFKRLERVLKLEAQQGYKNKAVVGGIGQFAAFWIDQAREEAVDEGDRAFVEQTSAVLSDYGNLQGNAARSESLNNLLGKLKQRQERVGAVSPPKPAPRRPVQPPKKAVARSPKKQPPAKKEQPKKKPPRKKQAAQPKQQKGKKHFAAAESPETENVAIHGAQHGRDKDRRNHHEDGVDKIGPQTIFAACTDLRFAPGFAPGFGRKGFHMPF